MVAQITLAAVAVALCVPTGGVAGVDRRFATVHSTAPALGERWQGDYLARHQPAGKSCDDAVRDPTAAALLSQMELLPKLREPAWNGYRPQDATYIFVVRPANANLSCGIVWQSGRVRTVLAMEAPPRFATPMFGFHSAGTPADAPGARTWTQPAAIDAQLTAAGIERAVLVPVNPAIKLPFQLTPLHLFDMAVHEAFHVFVQAPTWLGGRPAYPWPKWTAGPIDRAGLVSDCYGTDGSAVAPERGLLVEAAVAAFSGADTRQVCTSARESVRLRRDRWASTDRSASGGALSTASCRYREAVMELNEGVPDFVFWTTAHAVGAVGDQRLRQRLEAAQREVFYLTGSMQLMVLKRLAGPQGFAAITKRIAESASWRDGELLAILERELEIRCGPDAGGE
jgi:hypothetical protein